MYIITNAFKNLKRNIGRNILIAVIMLVLISAISVAIIINNTSKAIIKEYQNKFGSQIYINLDMEKLSANKGEEYPEIPGKTYLNFGNSSYLNKVNLTAMSYVDAKTIQPLEMEKNENSGSVVFSGKTSTGAVMEGESSGNMEKAFTMYGYTDLNQDSRFQNKTRRITEGSVPKQNGECLISKALAEKNGLKLGDEIDFTGREYGKSGEPTPKGEIHLKIVGMYEDEPTNKTDKIMFEMTNKSNDIYVSIETLVNNETIPPVNVDGTFYLRSPEDLKAFEAELRAKGLPDSFKVTIDEDAYHTTVAPIQGLANIAVIFTIIVLIFGIFVLILLSLLSNRERKYEVGVLRSMGMSKAKISLNFILESFMMMIVCLVIGLTIGTQVAKPVSDSLIKSQIEAENNKSKQNGMFVTSIAVGGNFEQAKPLEQIDTRLDTTSLLQIIGISIVLVIISNAVSILYITKFEPINILSERS